MAPKDVYLQRLSRCLDAAGELDFLSRLSDDELAVLWTKIARQRLRQHPYDLTARGA